MPGWKERGALATLFFSDKLCSYLNVSNAINYWFSLFSVHLHRSLHSTVICQFSCFFICYFLFLAMTNFWPPRLFLRPTVCNAQIASIIFTHVWSLQAFIHPPTHAQTPTHKNWSNKSWAGRFWFAFVWFDVFEMWTCCPLLSAEHMQCLGTFSTWQ